MSPAQQCLPERPPTPPPGLAMDCDTFRGQVWEEVDDGDMIQPGFEVAPRNSSMEKEEKELNCWEDWLIKGAPKLALECIGTTKEVDSVEDASTTNDTYVLQVDSSSRASSSRSRSSSKSSDRSSVMTVPPEHGTQNLFIFDWDDTICPSSACMEEHNLSVAGPPPDPDVAAILADLALQVKELFEFATKWADKIVIVTNARPGWVRSSCTAWLPDLVDTIKDMEIASARAAWEPTGVLSPTGWKQREFESCIKSFLDDAPRMTVKNIVCIGDAPFEHDALRRVMSDASDRRYKRCRSKSVRFLLKPTVDMLTCEIWRLRNAFANIVEHDGDLDVEIMSQISLEPFL